MTDGQRLPRRLLAIMLVAVLAGVAAAAFTVLGYFSTRHAQAQQAQDRSTESQDRADQRIQDLENANTFVAKLLVTLQKNQECVITLLLMTPEKRVRLTNDELALICPPVPRLQIGSGEDSAASTTTTSSPQTTTTTAEPQQPTPTPTPTTTQPQPPEPAPCLTLPLLGCVSTEG